jgi:hypothetical protein
MLLNFRQGVVSHQTGGFLNLNPSGNVDLVAENRPVTVTIAHAGTNYLYSEDSSIDDAWIGPFDTNTRYWLFWDFDTLNFSPAYGSTTLEPVYQPVAPGYNIPTIVNAVPGAGSPDALGSFVVNQHFILPTGRAFEVRNSSANDGFYTTSSSVYDPVLGRTTIFVEEEVPGAVADGNLYLEFDTFGQPLLQTGRIWYDTSTHRTFVYTGSSWAERIRVFAAQLYQLSFSPLGTNAPPNFTGTQIGDVSSIRAGRVMYTDSFIPIIRDDGTFLTTEDQFFANASRVDALRLESNVARARSSMVLGAFSVVGWTADGVISVADYDMVGRGSTNDPLPPDDRTTVIGMLTEDLLPGETGSIIVQGVITNPEWNWLDVTHIGAPLWVDNGMLVPQDPHFNDVINFPVARNAVARVLARDTIVFDQGLGGRGARGPAGVFDISDLTLPYDMSFAAFGSPDTPNVTLGMFPITRNVLISMDDTSHRAYAETPGDVTVTYRLFKNANQVGTVTFLAGSSTGTVAFDYDIDLAPGDVLKFVAPTSANAVISNVAVTVVACAVATPYCSMEVVNEQPPLPPPPDVSFTDLLRADPGPGFDSVLSSDSVGTSGWQNPGADNYFVLGPYIESQVTAPTIVDTFYYTTTTNEATIPLQILYTCYTGAATWSYNIVSSDNNSLTVTAATPQAGGTQYLVEVTLDPREGFYDVSLLEVTANVGGSSSVVQANIATREFQF